MGSSAPVTAYTSPIKKLIEVTRANIMSLVGVAEAAPAEASDLTHQVAKIPKWDGLRIEQWRSVSSSHRSHKTPCSKGSPPIALKNYFILSWGTLQIYPTLTSKRRSWYCRQSHRLQVRNSTTYPTDLDAVLETSWKNPAPSPLASKWSPSAQ